MRGIVVRQSARQQATSNEETSNAIIFRNAASAPSNARWREKRAGLLTMSEAILDT